MKTKAKNEGIEPSEEMLHAESIFQLSEQITETKYPIGLFIQGRNGRKNIQKLVVLLQIF